MLIIFCENSSTQYLDLRLSFASSLLSVFIWFAYVGKMCIAYAEHPQKYFRGILSEEVIFVLKTLNNTKTE